MDMQVPSTLEPLVEPLQGRAPIDAFGVITIPERFWKTAELEPYAPLWAIWDETVIVIKKDTFGYGDCDMSLCSMDEHGKLEFPAAFVSRLGHKEAGEVSIMLSHYSDEIIIEGIQTSYRSE